MKKEEPYRTLGNFACFQCRKTFSRWHVFGETTKKCPTCGGLEIFVGPKWKSPKKDSEEIWKVVELFVKSRNGYVFLYKQLNFIPFPRSIEKAKLMIQKMCMDDTERSIQVRLDEAKKIKQIKKNVKSIEKSEKTNMKKSRMKGLVKLKYSEKRKGN